MWIQKLNYRQGTLLRDKLDSKILLEQKPFYRVGDLVLLYESSIDDSPSVEFFGIYRVAWVGLMKDAFNAKKVTMKDARRWPLAWVVEVVHI